MVVDDENAVGERLVRLLTALNCQVDVETDPAKAVARIRRRRRPPDILVTDVVLGDQSGFDLANQARERFPSLPVVFFSGYVDHRRSAQPESSLFVAKSAPVLNLVDALSELSGVPLTES
jgi:CheY-like chemotaxis protein